MHGGRLWVLGQCNLQIALGQLVPISWTGSDTRDGHPGDWSIIKGDLSDNAMVSATKLRIVISIEDIKEAAEVRPNSISPVRNLDGVDIAIDQSTIIIVRAGRACRKKGDGLQGLASRICQTGV